MEVCAARRADRRRAAGVAAGPRHRRRGPPVRRPAARPVRRRGRRRPGDARATPPTRCPSWTPTRSTSAEQVDHALLTALVDRELFEPTEIREHEWNPLRHNPGPLLHALLARPFAPAEVRLTSLAGRLAAVPDALATARATLRDMPRIHAETAVGQFAGTAALIRDEVPALLAQAPGAARPGRAGGRRRRSPRWRSSSPGCAPGLAADAGPGRDPRLGRRRWEARLWHTLDTELGAAEVQRRAWANLDRVTAEIREAAVELVGGPADDETVRRALDLLAAEHPDDAHHRRPGRGDPGRGDRLRPRTTTWSPWSTTRA